jgi:hypothetical protein
VFVPGKSFQPIVMFVGKARDMPNKTLFSCSTLG